MLADTPAYLPNLLFEVLFRTSLSGPLLRPFQAAWTFPACTSCVLAHLLLYASLSDCNVTLPCLAHKACSSNLNPKVNAPLTENSAPS